MKPLEVYNERYYRPSYFWVSLRARLNLWSIRRHIHINPGDRVLEIGCDRGQMTEQLRQLAPASIGVDVNAAAVARSGKEYLYIMDAQYLNFPDQSFDIILSIHTIEHIPDLVSAINEMERVLRPGGRLVLIYPWEPIRGCQALPEAVLLYRSLRVCREFHLHRLTPGKLRRLTQTTSLVERKWRVLFAPQPSFLSVLVKGGTIVGNRHERWPGVDCSV